MKRPFLQASYLAICVLMAGCTQTFDAFWKNPSSRLDVSVPSDRAVEMRYFGVSSFLIRDGDAALMIDGFFTRPKHLLLRSIEPEQEIVKSTLIKSGIELPNACGAPVPDDKNLDAIFAMHGHYDHALDTPMIATLTGAALFEDDVVRRIKDETLKYHSKLCPVQKTIDTQEIAQTLTRNVGAMTVSLINAEHSTNTASRLLEEFPYNENWEFPTYATNLKQGKSFAVHVETSGGNVLIVSTAGKIEQQFANDTFPTEVIFLGIGALGLEDRDFAKDYWDKTVIASGARRVVPIHWDTHAPPLFIPGATIREPKSLRLDKLDRVLGWFKEFIQEAPDDRKIELVSVPAHRPFDPFAPLGDQR